MALPARAALIAEGGFDRAAFDAWVRIRAGTGGPVFWYSEGTVRASPSGALLAHMVGVDAARAHWPEPGVPLAHQYSRKIYILRDPRTGAVIGEPIAYPYQFITYRLVGDRVETMVEQGAGARLTRIGPGGNMVARRLGRSYIFTAPLFLDMVLPGGRRLEAFENYDFVADPEAPPTAWALSWLRVGDVPAELGGGRGIFHLATRRFEAFDAMPEAMRTYILEKAPLWRAPPADLAEIRRLQAG